VVGRKSEALLSQTNLGIQLSLYINSDNTTWREQ